MRWNRLYRSGTMHAMTKEDLAFISDRGIRHVYDLRSSTERRDFPSPLHGCLDIEYSFSNHDQSTGDITKLLKGPETQPEHSRDAMMALYRVLPYEFRDAYQELFYHLAEGDLPLVFNCAAGKDRTGVAAALVLTALGVPREIIIEDYLITDEFFDRSCEIVLSGSHAEFFSGVDRKVWEPLLRADAAYLHVMFDELTINHGSVDLYLSKVLGINSRILSEMESNLLS